MVGEHAYLYAMVGISVESGYRWSDKRQSGKRRSALFAIGWIFSKVTRKTVLNEQKKLKTAKKNT